MADIPLQAENPYQFSAKRFVEMSNLLKVLRAPKQTKLVFQTLPKHMRRRAATQNPKRLPRRLRATHMAQFKKSGTPIKSKRPTRKYRRKPVSLRTEYAQRVAGSKPGWLETHLWHAKRFHMVTRWGYRLPWSPCDKSYRACYRATSKYCLLQDVSYLTTLQLSGPLEVLKEGFRKVSSAKCGPTMNAKCFLDGKREGQLYLFRANQYPLGCLGSVTFFWLPPTPQGSTVWLTAHPALVQQVKQELAAVFQSPDGGIVQIKDLEREFNRFRLSGPLAHLVLTRALKGVTVRDRKDLALHAFLSGQEDTQNTQQQFWSSLQQCENVSQVPSHSIVSVVVEDPRLNRPDGRQPVHSREAPNVAMSSIAEIPDRLNESALFQADMLQSVADNVMSPSQYSRARNASCAVPGQRCPFEDEMQVCPIILIQRPGERTGDDGRPGFNSGWDVVIPKGYGAVFWLSFVMWGGRAGGLREDSNTQREAKRHSFQPDTEAGQKEAALALANARDAYFRRPCNKRHNYTKLAIASPFLSPWKQLVREWGGQADNSMFVIRDRSVLEAIQRCLEGRTKDLPASVENAESALVPVTFKMAGRGRPGPHALICLPNATDQVIRGTKRAAAAGHGPICTEPLRRDPRDAQRKRCRSSHLRLLAQMRRKRVRAKRRLQRGSTQKVAITKPLTDQLIADQHRKMCELWLPSQRESVRGQCSRDTFGYCATADFSFVDAGCGGTGYVSLAGLAQQVSSSPSPSRVLIRDTTSRHYRSAQIRVALQW